MNVFQYASRCEQMFEMFLNDVGKERKTTFFSDLSIAECYGVKGVKDTYRQVMRSNCDWRKYFFKCFIWLWWGVHSPLPRFP